jgi:hypothetical protein
MTAWRAWVVCGCQFQVIGIHISMPDSLSVYSPTFS